VAFSQDAKARCLNNRFGHYFSGFPFMIFQQALKKALRSLAITPILKKHINHLTILIDRTP
jgi:hypothetical protein